MMAPKLDSCYNFKEPSHKEVHHVRSSALTPTAPSVPCKIAVVKVNPGRNGLLR